MYIVSQFMDIDDGAEVVMFVLMVNSLVLFDLQDMEGFFHVITVEISSDI